MMQYNGFKVRNVKGKGTEIKAQVEVVISVLADTGGAQLNIIL